MMYGWGGGKCTHVSMRVYTTVWKRKESYFLLRGLHSRFILDTLEETGH